MEDVSSKENQVKILLEEYKIFREEILQNISALGYLALQ
jgi:sRNA-binding carbon storage regulator CsrA